MVTMVWKGPNARGRVLRSSDAVWRRGVISVHRGATAAWATDPLECIRPQQLPKWSLRQGMRAPVPAGQLIRAADAGVDFMMNALDASSAGWTKLASSALSRVWAMAAREPTGRTLLKPFL